jgi:aryl-alcohol dehydrogenase-like predicted oxidoreductase
VNEAEAIGLMRSAFDLGCAFFDTAESYAAGDNERLVGPALAPIRDHVVIATKFRVGDSASGAEVSWQIRARLEASLRRLGTVHVELYYQHRVSPSVPTEDVAAVMGELIADGKIGGWGQISGHRGPGPPSTCGDAADRDPERVLDHGADVRGRRHSRLC